MEEATAMPVFCPAVVEGKHAVKKALADGLFPVVDKSIDVFAVPSAPGYLVYLIIIMIHMYLITKLTYAFIKHLQLPSM